jgi:5-methylcytosine-specific restriction endonuclease McrA
MPSRPCLKCHRLTRDGSYCPEHTPPKFRKDKRPSPSSRATDRPGWNQLRAQALARDRGACVVCGSTDGLAVHHRIPVADGGPNVLSNVETRCKRCHRAAH